MAGSTICRKKKSNSVREENKRRKKEKETDWRQYCLLKGFDSLGPVTNVSKYQGLCHALSPIIFSFIIVRIKEKIEKSEREIRERNT